MCRANMFALAYLGHIVQGVRSHICAHMILAGRAARNSTIYD